MAIELSARAARRYILGRQGLWPGRRWSGIDGTEQAMRAIGHLQLDPLNVVARAHDLMLQSRVIGYRPDDWARLTYEERRFFEWGGWLAVRPIDELPHWRTLMRRETALPRWRDFAREHRSAIAEMRRALQERETIANRDFAMASRTRVDSYRGRKDSAVALHYLWRRGEAMVVRRERFERVYARTEAVAPAELLTPSPDRVADDFHLRKLVASSGPTRFRGVSDLLARRVAPDELRRWRDARVRAGDLLEVTVEGWKGPFWALGANRDVLDELQADGTPPAWAPLESSTVDEATFLSPLEPVSARGRARELFGFDYTWEVYTLAAKRRFGYYVLPILRGESLVGRFDSRLDRASGTLVVLGLWLEAVASDGDAALVAAIRAGMRRFLAFLGASGIDVEAVASVRLRRALAGLRPLPPRQTVAGIEPPGGP
jgi:uncharacterized protein YcaQ